MKPSQGTSKKKLQGRVISAVEAMEAIGIDPELARSVLKNLLKVYGDNWEYIEEENYRLLADSIFESQGEESKCKKDDEDEEGKDDRNVNNELGNVASNRKRPVSPGVAGVRDEPMRRVHNDAEDARNNGKTDLDIGGSSRKRPGKEIVAKTSGDVGVIEGCCRDVWIASSATGEVTLALKCSSVTVDSEGFRMPSFRDVCKLVEDRRLSSAKKLDPNFSVMNLMKEICECVLDLGSKSEGGAQREKLVQMVPKQKMIPKVEGSLRLEQRVGDPENSGNVRSKKKLKPTVPEPPSGNSNGLVVHQSPQVALDDDVKRLVNPRDITNGQERYKIPLVCEEDASNDFPSFHYVRHNIIYQKASVQFSLARIGDENCCVDCYGDCLEASIPCACARETGGEFAYTTEGLLEDSFLDSYIAKYRHTQDHHLHFCQNCPVERIKNELKPEQCKGHLIGTFIKECWTKCGCSRLCGNRIVQRGIRCHLEVFYTDERKGWGLRSPAELPRGTFVCEYAGEILTNTELHERTVCATGNKKHTYPVLLDADWASEGILEDEDALCLDATNYGNVARFMNHRCCDANLIEIPVEIETPDHHYYHVAFFTTRKVEPYEELCWDYGIDFNDQNHPIKAFRCSCGSKLCRDKNRSRKKTFNQIKSKEVLTN